MGAIQELFLKGKSLLQDFSEPDLEAKVLLLKCSSLTEQEFYSYPERKLSRKQERDFYRLISKRLTGFPLAYLTGAKEFWSIPFRVSPGVLIPRPETELIVEKLLELSSKNEETIIDIGTGSGNIAVSLAKELPRARIFATDTSRRALKVARLNARLQNTTNIIFIFASLFYPLKKLGLNGKCDFIVSNPPYVTEREWAELSEEVKNCEPKKALVAGESGLEVIEKLIQDSLPLLKAGGHLIIEIGDDQREKVLSLFGFRWSNLRCFNDLNGIPRVIVARKKEK